MGIRMSGQNLARNILAAILSLAALLTVSDVAMGQRVFGLDTSSAANTNAPSQTQWNNAKNSGWAAAGIPSFQFAIVRSSRGGTIDATRLDDGHFYDNITRATNAGMLAGSYHYTRPDAIATHTAIDDANHYLERAGMYMKPGYLLPVFDLEAGNTTLSTAQMTDWSMDFVDTIFAAKGIYAIVYTNSSYNNDEVGAELAWFNFGSTPKSDPRTFQWVARPSGSLITGEPGAATNYPNPYGVWDANYISRTNSRDPAVNPWAFWQNGSAKSTRAARWATGSLSTSTPLTATLSLSKTSSSRRCGPMPAAETGEPRRTGTATTPATTAPSRAAPRRACRTIRASTG